MLKALFMYLDGGHMRQSSDQSTTFRSSPHHHSFLKDTFWSELKNGMYMHKVRSLQLAIPALQRACALAPQVLSKSFGFDLNFVKELFSTLSPVNTMVCPDVRRILLQYLSALARDRLTATHPIAVICHELQQDSHDREVSERALTYMLDAVQIYGVDGVSGNVSFDLEKTIVALLRRDKDLEAAARKAQVLCLKALKRLSVCQTAGWYTDANRELEQARMAATELSHVRIDQRDGQYDEAIKLSIFVLTGDIQFTTTDDIGWRPSPVDLPEFIKDKRSVYTLEDLAKIYDTLQYRNRAIQWLEQARMLAVELFGNASESTATAHIVEKLEQMRGLPPDDVDMVQ